MRHNGFRVSRQKLASNNPFADLAPDLQQETLGQERTLTNLGLRSDLSYAKGIHNLKAGVTYQHTLLDENNRFGIVGPTLLSSLADVNGDPCVDAGGNPIAAPCTTLAPFDLTRGGPLFPFHGHTDISCCPSTCRTRSPRETAPSTSACEAISTTA